VFGGKSNALHRAYLAGLQAQTSVYGATIPVYYGRTRGNPLVTWAANLREGSSLTQKKSSLFFHPTTYVRNADYLIGHNPIVNLLQMWWNNNKLSLNFVKYTALITYPFANSNGHVTIPDAEFYCVLAVTANVAYDETFDDYGGQGPNHVTGVFEAPLWNVNYAGPDPTDQNGYRQYPAVYQWLPGSGPTVNFPPGAVSLIPNIVPDGASFDVNIYYAQLSPGAWNFHSKHSRGIFVPCNALRFGFESVLGSDAFVYTDDGAPAEQQIQYPAYAGMGSSFEDCGVSGVAPPLLAEVLGSFPVNDPDGDADHADMIEDIFKSGPAQAGSGAPAAYGDLHHGLGCLDFPGTIQKKVVYGGVQPWLDNVTFDLANTKGNYLFCQLVQDTLVPQDVGISDTAGNAWTPLYPPTLSKQLWYCVAKAAQSNKITFTNIDRFMSVTLLEIGGLDTLDGAPAYAAGTGGKYQATVTPTNRPGEDALILSFVSVDPGQGPIPAPPFHWERSVNGGDSVAAPSLAIDLYRTKFPKAYPLSYSFGGGAHWNVVLLCLKNSEPNTFTSPLGDILDDATMRQARLQARAYGLNGSLVMDSQKKASDWLEELYRVLNAAPVWSGFRLKSIPYAEQSFAGRGAVYVSPTAAGPVIDLTEDDFIADETNPPVTVTRKAQVDAPNLHQIQAPNRDSNYDVSVTAEADNGSMTLYGTRKDSPKAFASIQTTRVARMILGIISREQNIIRNAYSFRLQARVGIPLEAMDLVMIPKQAVQPAPDPARPVAGAIALRLTSVKTDGKYGVACEAEPFIYGLRTPLPLTVSVANPNLPAFGGAPPDVNVPVIFEAVPAIAGKTNLGELWLVLSAAGNYGGCVAYMSTDGGASYPLLGPNGGGIITGSATTGVSTADWPAGADPDTANDLPVDLTESAGALASFQVSDEDNFVYPCYIAGGGANPIPYGLLAYAIANLTAPNKYTLKATGGGTNHLRRSVFGAPCPSPDVDHPNGSRFAFLDPNNPAPAGILRLPLNPAWIGVTLHFKFTSFNAVHGGVQDVATVTDYTFTPTGVPGGVNPSGIGPVVGLVNGA
jgi:hypothetical protein